MRSTNIDRRPQGWRCSPGSERPRRRESVCFMAYKVHGIVPEQPLPRQSQPTPRPLLLMPISAIWLDKKARMMRQTSTTPPPVWNARKGRLLIFPFVYVGGNLQRLGIGEMLAGLIGEALIEDERMAVFAGRDLETALQGNPLRFSGLSNFPAAINVAKVIGADFVVYGSHRHYTNVLAVDARAVHVKTMEVLTSEHLKSYGTDKIRASSQALAAKLRPILADAVQQAIC